MAYNKASEERKWRLWKEAEEKQLRELGVSEDRIAQLRAYDWEIFNSDRRYYEHHAESGDYLEQLAADEEKPDVKTVSDFLDGIDSPALDQLVSMTKELTDTLRANKTIDWQKKQSARAKMRKIIKRLLKKYNYPPEGQDDALQTVMTQCELWTDNLMEL